MPYTSPAAKNPTYKMQGNSPAAYAQPSKPRSYSDLIGISGARGMASRPSYASFFDPAGRVNIPGVAQGLDDQFNAANEANLGRYNQQLDLATRSRDESLGYLDQYGTDAKNQISRTANEDLSNYDSDAISRGIYNTSFTGNDKRQIKEGRDRQLAAVDERANLLRSDVSSRGYSDLIGIVGSRQDEGPNIPSYLNMIQQEAALRAEESKRNQDQANLKTQTSQNNASIPTAIVNGVPQYGGGIPGMQPQQQGGYQQIPGMLYGVSATSMDGGGPPLNPLSAGSDPWTQYLEQQRQYQQPQQQAPRQPAPAGGGGYGSPEYSNQTAGYRQGRLMRQLPRIPQGMNPFQR